MRNGSLWIRPRQSRPARLWRRRRRCSWPQALSGYSEKVSCVAAKRPELERALDQLEAGDVLVVTKLDRLARSTLDLLRIIDLIGKEGAGFKSLGDPWADTTMAA